MNKKNFNDQKINRNQRPPMNIVTYYSQPTDDFMKGIQEMRSGCDIIADIIPFENRTVDDVIESILDEFKYNVPSLETGEDLMWSMNISSTRCVLKTDKKISFGWKLKYDKVPGRKRKRIKEVVMQVTLFGDDMIEAFGANYTDIGWIKEEK